MREIEFGSEGSYGWADPFGARELQLTIVETDPLFSFLLFVYIYTYFYYLFSIKPEYLLFLEQIGHF